MLQIELSQSLIDAVATQSRRGGYSHTFCRYPAQFSHEFARAAIQEFSKPGDIILDPFMGGGTTLVEALALGRHAIGTDINPLAYLITRAKTTLISENDKNILNKWTANLPKKLSLKRAPSNNHRFWRENGYQKDLPWTLCRVIELAIDRIDMLPMPRLQRLTRCALLKTGQWALDCKTNFPSVKDFREKYAQFLEEQISGLEALREAVSAAAVKPKVSCYKIAIDELTPEKWKNKIIGKPSLVVTSPPYPSVHVIYHRWQIRGRKETSAPYWIASIPDGHGESFYTMGGRTSSGLNSYFQTLTASFQKISELLRPKALVVQLIAFSNVETQLPRYLNSMQQAGFENCTLQPSDKLLNSGLWREIPSRKWYANYKGEIPTSKELLLIHRKAK